MHTSALPAMNAVLNQIETSNEGSVELDAVVASVVGIRLSRYTTSLDEKLPWENIIGMEFDGSWYIAIHGDPGGRTYEGCARTEALARRAAALRAKIDEMRVTPPPSSVLATEVLQFAVPALP